MTSDIMPWIAIITSGSALGVSLLNYRRDRAVLQAKSSCIESLDDGLAWISIDIVNRGRRPIKLDSWAGAATQGMFRRIDGMKSTTSKFIKADVVDLSENETHNLRLELMQLESTLFDGETFRFDEIWIEDTVGRKHRIKGIRESIVSLRQWGEKNHYHLVSTSSGSDRI